MKITPFHPKSASQEDWARFHAFRRLRHKETDPEDPVPDDSTTQQWMKHGDPQTEVFRFAAFRAEDPDTIAGWLDFSIYTKDSPTYEKRKREARVKLQVLKPYRHRGIGKRLLRKATELARRHEKSLIFLDSSEDEGKAFLRAIGAQVAQRERESRLYLDRVDWRLVETWAEEGPRRSPNSSLHWFRDHMGEAVLEDYSRLLTEVVNQAPRDDLEMGDMVFTPEIIREWEETAVRMGGTTITAVTREADGALSGLTEMGYFPDQETMIRQFMTGVGEPYRGRGLGKWLKAVMLLRVREEYPQVRVVVTGNATSNAAMLSINERLGFRFHREGISAQMTLESLENYLSRQGRIGMVE
ncbi:MAG: GNAT family N-acetyltransferase [Candidatus Geothermarchaeales archaeon]